MNNILVGMKILTLATAIGMMISIAKLGFPPIVLYQYHMIVPNPLVEDGHFERYPSPFSQKKEDDVETGI